MRCEVFEARMQRLLDQRQPPEQDAGLQAHALSCSDCREMLQIQEQLFLGLEIAAWKEEDDRPQPWVEGVVARVQRSTQRKRWGSALALVAATVACSLIYAFTPAPRRPLPELTENPPVVTPTSPHAVPRQIAGAPAPPGLLQVDSQELLHSLTDLAAQIPEVPTMERIDRLGLTSGLRPIASSFNAAFGVIRRTIPIRRPPERSNPQADRLPDLTRVVWS